MNYEQYLWKPAKRYSRTLSMRAEQRAAELLLAETLLVNLESRKEGSITGDEFCLAVRDLASAQHPGYIAMLAVHQRHYPKVYAGE